MTHPLSTPRLAHGQFGTILCVGGPCAGTRIQDAGSDVVRVQVPRDFRWNDGAPVGIAMSEPSWVAYQRCIMELDGTRLMVLVPDGRVTPSDVIRELVRGYNPAPR